MDADRFDSLARALRDAASRRAIFRLLATSTLGGALASLAAGTEARARKRKRRKCRPCRKRKNGTCKGKKPNGRVCGPNKVCQGGKCVRARDPQIPGCSASNDFCSEDWATCLNMFNCGCLVTVEGDSICGDRFFGGCPNSTDCTSSDECDDDEFCVALPCCPEGKSTCVQLCVPPE